MSDSDIIFSNFMKGLRVKAQLTIDEAARKIGVGVGTIQDWEAGISFPSELSAQRISNIYKIPQQEWLDALRAHAARILKDT